MLARDRQELRLFSCLQRPLVEASTLLFAETSC
jgi:hypothetical protein